MIYIKNPSSLRVIYMIPQRTNEIKVVNTNFKKICGLLGAPGSSIPVLSNFFLLFFIFKGSDMKKIIHHMSRNKIIDPVIPNLYFF